MIAKPIFSPTEKDTADGRKESEEMETKWCNYFGKIGKPLFQNSGYDM